MSESNSLFYKNLRSFSDEKNIFNESFYNLLPDDWSIIITDIKSSTQAIEDGFFKAVNTIGVASILAAKNACNGIEIPFIFGGDGATIFIPSEMTTKTYSALSVTQFTAAEQFNLDLRICIIPMTEIKVRGGEIYIAKRKLSQSANLAMAKGNGLSIAENLTKNSNDYSQTFSKSDYKSAHAGFVCKFKPVKSKNGQILTIMVQACNDNFEVYREILNHINKTAVHININNDYKTVQYSDKSTFVESKLFHRGIKKYLVFVKNSITMNFVSFIFNLLHKPLLSFKDLEKNTDQLKFDNTLRTILDVSPLQRDQILHYLSTMQTQNKIFYGYHLSEAALMTCYIGSSPDDEHFHFIDGDDGGYAVAAQKLKQNIKAFVIPKTG